LENFVKKIIDLRWLIITIVIVFTVLLGYQVKNLRINADILSSLPDDDPDAALLKEIGEKFGSNNMGIIILSTDNIYQMNVVEDIKSITDTLGLIDGILSVTSLTNIFNIRADENGFEIGKLVDEYNMPATPEAFEDLKQKVLANEMYKGSIVSEDGKATLIIFTLKEDADVQVVAKTVIEKTESLASSGKLYYTGSPMLVTYISDLMKNDLIRLLPFAFLLITIILFLSFRSFSGVVFPLLTAVVAIIWSLGTMSVLGIELSMISNNIPIILLAIGTAYAIHVINRVNQIENSDRKKAINKALEFVMIPVILSALTTMIGFLSFIFGSYLKMIAVFGIFTALGTFFACLLSIFFIPAMLSLFNPKNRNKKLISSGIRKSLISEKFLKPLYYLLFKHPKYILLTWSILILISVAGIYFIKRSVDIKEYFKEGNPAREAENIMEEKFGGTKPIFVVINGDMQSPEVLKTMIETGDYMERDPNIYHTQSVADLIMEINNAMTGIREIPAEREKIEQLWFLLEGNETMQRFVTEDLQQGIIMSKFKSPDNKAKRNFTKYMDKFIHEHSREDCRISITGMPFVDVTMDKSLLNSQLASITIAVIFVIFIVGLILRSVKSGIYAAIPIIAAIIILFGVMGIAGISLNIATVLVASVVVGMGIDFSIHVITHFNHIYKITGDTKKAIEETIMISGKAIVINVLSVSAGFLILVFSEMVPLQYFGFLIVLSMIGSGLGATTLLPVILILVHRKKLNKS
jgi:predicted RND superfamily exporter protein